MLSAISHITEDIIATMSLSARHDDSYAITRVTLHH